MMMLSTHTYFFFFHVMCCEHFSVLVCLDPEEPLQQSKSPNLEGIHAPLGGVGKYLFRRGWLSK